MKTTTDTSQNAEVTYMRAILDESVPKTIIDVGASDGQWYSTSKPFIEEGWRAVCIEPHPSVFATLEKNHAHNERVTCRKIAISDKNGTERLFLGNNGNMAVSTICTDENPWFNTVRSTNSVPVETATLDTILNEEGVTEIGILSIDAEGMDLEVLNGFDFKRFRPRVILTEEYLCNPVKNTAKFSLLKHHNYVLLASLGDNTVWIPQECFAMYRHLKTVTIVVPVFNRWDVVKECIATLKEHVAHHHKILIIDDASTEEGMEEHVQTMISDMDNAQYIRNDTNLGFVGTCNRVRELDASKNDILLLNSDAMLTKGSLEEMLCCLHANEHHGVCCPRSNAATIYTIDHQIHDPLDAYSCWKSMHHLLPRYSDMPTGHGFCMLIRRELIERFGLFDPIYGRGYNEENDFCMRVGRYGFRAVAANHAFAFHKGKASFGTEQSTLEQQNRAILDKRYPEFTERLKEFFWNEPGTNHFAGQLASIHRKRVAVDLTHLSVAWNGTSTYIFHILPKIVHAFIPHTEVIVITSKAVDAFFGLSKKYSIHYYSHEYSERFDLVFVPQQIFGLAHLSFINRIAPRWVITMHDLIANHCGHLRTGDMQLCTNVALMHGNAIITVSEAAKQDMPDTKNITVIHHGFDAIHVQKQPTEDFVLIVGNHFEHKGIAKTIEHLPRSVHAVVLGGKHHKKLATTHITVHESGALSDAEITSLYARCRAVIFPSLYEGFGLPLLNATQHNKPIIAFDTAATREIATAFALNNITYITAFSDLHHCIHDIESKPVHPAPLSRTWNDVALDTLRVLETTLKTPIDPQKLDARFAAINSYMKLRSEYDELRRRTRPLPIRLIHILIATLLSPFPILKSRIHTLAHSIGIA